MLGKQNPTVIFLFLSSCFSHMLSVFVLPNPTVASYNSLLCFTPSQLANWAFLPLMLSLVTRIRPIHFMGIPEYLFCAVNAECGRGSEGGHKAEQDPVPVKETSKQSLQ